MTVVVAVAELLPGHGSSVSLVTVAVLLSVVPFGVLAFSGIPVVRALGVTVASMVVAALVVIELEHLAPLGRKP